MIKSYCKKDKCVEAIQWNGSNIYEVSRFLKKNVTACFDGSYVRVDGVLGEIGCYITVNDKGIFWTVFGEKFRRKLHRDKFTR